MWEADEQKNQVNGLEYAAIFPGYYYGPFEVLKISVSTQQPGFKCAFWQFFPKRPPFFPKRPPK